MTPLWKNDISILYEKKYLLEVIPKEEYDINRKLNSIVRISIYYSLIMYLVKKDINNLLIPIIVSIITIIISNKSESKKHNTIINLMNGNTEDGNLIDELEHIKVNMKRESSIGEMDLAEKINTLKPFIAQIKVKKTN